MTTYGRPLLCSRLPSTGRRRAGAWHAAALARQARARTCAALAACARSGSDGAGAAFYRAGLARTADGDVFSTFAWAWAWRTDAAELNAIAVNINSGADERQHGRVSACGRRYPDAGRGEKRQPVHAAADNVLGNWRCSALGDW